MMKNDKNNFYEKYFSEKNKENKLSNFYENYFSEKDKENKSFNYSDLFFKKCAQNINLKIDNKDKCENIKLKEKLDILRDLIDTYNEIKEFMSMIDDCELNNLYDISPFSYNAIMIKYYDNIGFMIFGYNNPYIKLLRHRYKKISKEIIYDKDYVIIFPKEEFVEIMIDIFEEKRNNNE